LNPIFAVTGIFRIFITYGFWQGIRNNHPENQRFFGPDHLKMNFDNMEGDLASWFNLCGLVWFFSGLFPRQFRVKNIKLKRNYFYYFKRALSADHQGREK